MKKKAVKKKAVKKKLVKKKVVKKKAVKKKAVKKKAVKKKLETSDGSSISLQITSNTHHTKHLGGEFEDEVENYLRKKFGVDVSVSSNSYDHINDDSVDRMTDVNIEFSPIPKDKSFKELEEGDELMDIPKWLDKVENIISKENPDYESMIVYVQECDRGEE